MLPKEKEELDKFLHARYFGKSDVFKQYSYFSNDFETKSNNYLRNEVLKYDKNKINLFLFTNVYWDVGVSDSARLFNNLISWVLETIKLVEKYPDKLYLYIKTHPAEKFDSASSLKTVIDLIREKYFLLPKNVTFILPEQKVNTYQLFPYINIGIVYNGTLGLEMLLNNVPVIAVAKAPYSNLGFACEPNDIDEYEKLLTGEKPMQKPFEKKDKLELFAYFYFIKTKKLFSIFALIGSILIKVGTIFLVPVYLLTLLNKVKGEKVYIYATISMFFVFLLSPLREELYPWYAIWFLAFVSLIPGREKMKELLIFFSLGLMLRYIPYMWSGNYFGATPLVRNLLMVIPPILYLFSLWLKRIYRS